MLLERKVVDLIGRIVRRRRGRWAWRQRHRRRLRERRSLRAWRTNKVGGVLVKFVIGTFVSHESLRWMR
jgi:hypothetical protein